MKIRQRKNGPAENGAPMRIMLATDGSRGSDAALRLVARLAAREGMADLTVVTIASRGDAGLAGRRAKGDQGPSGKILSETSRRLAARGVTADSRLVRVRETEGVPEAIVREAEKLKADLIVVGSEGRDTLNEWVVGGVALRLIYLSRRPVVVVRAPRKRART